MSDDTARLRLPTIWPGQAQKEVFHNEALALIDLLLHGAVVAVGLDMPPAVPTAGQCWVIGGAPVGAWTGKPHHVAGWTEGGWRFVPPAEGMALWLSEAAGFVRFSSGGWTTGDIAGSRVMIGGKAVLGARRAAVMAPTGGTTIDAEARGAITAILAALRAHGLIET